MVAFLPSALMSPAVRVTVALLPEPVYSPWTIIWSPGSQVVFPVSDIATLESGSEAMMQVYVTASPGRPFPGSTSFEHDDAVPATIVASTSINAVLPGFIVQKKLFNYAADVSDAGLGSGGCFLGSLVETHVDNRSLYSTSFGGPYCNAISYMAEFETA